MKQFITLKPMKTSGYKVLEPVNSKFYALYETLEFHFYQKKSNLIDWLYDEIKPSRTNEWISIRKERGAIALYDVSAWIDETYTGDYLDPEKRFEMTIPNFLEILIQWEELRISMPDTILVVIHEDNHVSLEIDPVIIKQYQDAGYAFDINKSDN